MGIFAGFSKLFDSSKQVITKVVSPFFTLEDKTNRDYNPENFINNAVNNDSIAVVHSCINLLSNSLSKLDYCVYEHSEQFGKHKSKEHPLYYIINKRPNPFQTSNVFINTLENHRLMFGNAFAKIHKKNGGVSWFEILHPSTLQGYRLDRQSGELFFYFNDGIEDQIINNQDLIHLKFSTQDNGVLGLNPLYALYRELNNIFQGRITLNNSYKNNLSISRYIKTAGAFNSTVVKEAIEKIKEEYKGSANAGNIPTLPAGFEIAQLPQISIQDAQILESIRFSKDDILEFFGVKNLLNTSFTATDFYNNVLQNTLKHYEQEFEYKCLYSWELDRYTIEFDLDSQIEQEFDIEKRAKYYEIMWKLGVYSGADIQKKLGKKPSVGSEKHYIQVQYIPVEDYEKFAPMFHQQQQYEKEGNQND